MEAIMEGEATPAQIAAFITALRIKGETVDEIAGCARVMREKAAKITPRRTPLVDTCGTGGDGANTFNISKIGRASCRERVKVTVVAVATETKHDGEGPGST